jgi:hypothetical protein
MRYIQAGRLAVVVSFLSWLVALLELLEVIALRGKDERGKV